MNSLTGYEEFFGPPYVVGLVISSGCFKWLPEDLPTTPMCHAVTLFALLMFLCVLDSKYRMYVSVLLGLSYVRVSAWAAICVVGFLTSFGEKKRDVGLVQKVQHPIVGCVAAVGFFIYAWLYKVDVSLIVCVVGLILLLAVLFSGPNMQIHSVDGGRMVNFLIIFALILMLTGGSKLYRNVEGDVVWNCGLSTIDEVDYQKCRRGLKTLNAWRLRKSIPFLSDQKYRGIHYNISKLDDIISVEDLDGFNGHVNKIKKRESWSWHVSWIIWSVLSGLCFVGLALNGMARRQRGLDNEKQLDANQRNPAFIGDDQYVVWRSIIMDGGPMVFFGFLWGLSHMNLLQGMVSLAAFCSGVLVIVYGAKYRMGIERGRYLENRQRDLVEAQVAELNLVRKVGHVVLVLTILVFSAIWAFETDFSWSSLGSSAGALFICCLLLDRGFRSEIEYKSLVLFLSMFVSYFGYCYWGYGSLVGPILTAGALFIDSNLFAHFMKISAVAPAMFQE